MDNQNKKILPPATIGIIGGGQLGRMMAISARNMGYGIVVLEPAKSGPLAQIADIEINAPYDDMEALSHLVAYSDIVTYEFENVPHKQVGRLKKMGYIPQGEDPLFVTSHRLREKLAVREAGFKTAPFLAVMSQDELRYAIKQIGYPAILKTISGGYDGKGQWVLRGEEDLPVVLEVVKEGEYILEGFVDFSVEVSVVVVRSTTGEIEAFPVTENEHVNGILHTSIVPARVSEKIKMEANEVAVGLIRELDFVGTLAIEMFVTDDGIVVNEMAPRPHNSGHWTMDGANVSQFEQHIRAICGLPLVKPEVKGCAVMTNLLGQHVDYALKTWSDATLGFNDGKLHLYGKDEAKKDRKMGHINFAGANWAALEEKVNQFLADMPE